MINHECDKCHIIVKGKPGAVKTLPEGWYTLNFGLYPHQVYFHICTGCRKILRIPATSPDEGIADRLLEIISELVDEAVEAAVDNRS